MMNAFEWQLKWSSSDSWMLSIWSLVRYSLIGLISSLNESLKSLRTEPVVLQLISAANYTETEYNLLKQIRIFFENQTLKKLPTPLRLPGWFIFSPFKEWNVTYAWSVPNEGTLDKWKQMARDGRRVPYTYSIYYCLCNWRYSLHTHTN